MCFSTSVKSRRILILNWRDISHPRAGGAEKVTHEIARRWVSWGHSVTLFCATYPSGVSEEMIDGVKIIRRGHQHTVHWEAFRHYRRGDIRGHDVIIDEVNTIPFFTPLYAHEPVLVYCNQLAREVWRYEAPFPLNAIGYLSEPLYLQPYRRTPVMTISRSTEDDLRQLGFRGPFSIIPMAVDIQEATALAAQELPREVTFTLSFVGRVVPSKRVDHIIRALALLRCQHSVEAKLWIIGSWDADYRRKLYRLSDNLGVTDAITFFGHVDEMTKAQLLARAHLLVMTSVREGWGLVVTEANVLGTPSVVYDSPGLRDSTVNGQTGVVCRNNTPGELAKAIADLYAQPMKYAELCATAQRIAKELNWDHTARAAWQVLQSVFQHA